MAKTATRPAEKGPAEAGGTARERLLAAASELFYAEGIHTVGIDRIIEKAGVAKASLYNTYGSKDELVRAYLDQRHDRLRARVAAVLEGVTDPREKILAVFTAQQQIFAQPDFRGCAFANATAESQPGSVAYDVADQYRGWLLDLFREFATEAKAPDADLLARQLQQLYDGAQLSARMDNGTGASAACRTTVQAVLDAALPQYLVRTGRSSGPISSASVVPGSIPSRMTCSRS
ncbi:MAG TPA: TetR/AcrR family transcriptional regulator [Jatrophihabitans sp.]|jgi:AcrR family transcriptional regulator